MKTVDLNADLGEGYGAYPFGRDEELMPLISSANVACGFHASDPTVMRRTVKLARDARVAVGAHPSFPDRQGFGRRVMQMSPDEVYDHVVYQIGALRGFLDVLGVSLHHVKPHGALYNVASVDGVVARAIACAVKDFGSTLKLYAPFGSELALAGKGCGVQVCHEVFADRRYEADGTLTARSHPDALIHDEDESCEQVLQMVLEGWVRARTGERVELRADTICLHGDGPNPVAFANKLRERLSAAGIRVECA